MLPRSRLIDVDSGVGETVMRKTIIIAATLFAGLAVTACNTVEGAGKDVSSAGKAVSETAKDVKN